MGHEISQFDIPDRQLMASSGRPGMWSDIGEAKITHSIFGGAKIRVIREKDKVIRAWLLAALAAVVLAVAAWQGWIALQQSKLLAVTPPLSERISVGAPVFHPEIVPPVKPASRGKSESLIQTEIDSLVSNPNARPPRPPALNASKPADAIPATAQPSIASKAQAGKSQTPLSTNNGPSLNQTNTQPHPKMPASDQPAAPAIASPPAAQPPANIPAPAAPPAEPLTRKDALKPSSASNGQTTEPNVQPVNARGTAIIFVQPDNAKP